MPVEVTVHPAAVNDILSSSGTRTMLFDAARPIVIDARGRAPKDTGAGARSIDSEVVLTHDEWEALISWDQLHYYMYFSERGDKERPPHAFLVPALRAAEH